MAYQRKTKDVYGLIWNNEEIDCFNTLKEAREMQKEYILLQMVYSIKSLLRVWLTNKADLRLTNGIYID